MKRLLVLAALPLLSSCGGAQQALHGGYGGLRGKVSRGPITPTCVQGKPCSAPARGVTLSFSKGGKVLASVKTGDDGGYRIRLPAGRYAVTGVRFLRPQQANVSDNGFRRLDFTIDTRIR